MSVFLLFVAAELAVAIHAMRARQEIILKWKKGELSMEELLYLKSRPWFQKHFPIAKLNHSTSFSKKCN